MTVQHTFMTSTHDRGGAVTVIATHVFDGDVTIDDIQRLFLPSIDEAARRAAREALTALAAERGAHQQRMEEVLAQALDTVTGDDRHDLMVHLGLSHPDGSDMGRKRRSASGDE